MSPRPTVLGPGEGRELALGAGFSVCFKADEDDYSVDVTTVRAKHPGTTAHLHERHDDVFFVTDGELAFEVDGETYAAPAGTFVLVPRGARHRWWNPRDEPATFLNLHAPSTDFEHFVRELSSLSAAGTATPEAMVELGRRHDVHFDLAELRSRYET